MQITWLGTAGFIINTPEGEIAFDPFISRNPESPSPFTIQSFINTRALFIGHGHFDHAYDIPKISQHSDSSIFAPGLTGLLLKMRGVHAQKLNPTPTTEYLWPDLKVRAFKSAHVRFDSALVLTTLKRCGVKGCANMCGQLLGYPKGLVQTYLFEAQGKKVLFISSAGCTNEELLNYRKLEIDYLLVPLQGHSHIQDIAAHQTLVIQPKAVIPHHHDDFFPPLSQNISVDIFKEKLKIQGYHGKILDIPLFQNVTV